MSAHFIASVAASLHGGRRAGRSTSILLTTTRRRTCRGASGALSAAWCCSRARCANKRLLAPSCCCVSPARTNRFSFSLACGAPTQPLPRSQSSLPPPLLLRSHKDLPARCSSRSTQLTLFLRLLFMSLAPFRPLTAQPFTRSASPSLAVPLTALSPFSYWLPRSASPSRAAILLSLKQSL
eukprot:5069193-Pleurochrysis_carterae.AAC.1